MWSESCKHRFLLPDVAEGHSWCLTPTHHTNLAKDGPPLSHPNQIMK
jgi:hypothetical protein